MAARSIVSRIRRPTSLHFLSQGSIQLNWPAACLVPALPRWADGREVRAPAAVAAALTAAWAGRLVPALSPPGVEASILDACVEAPGGRRQKGGWGHKRDRGGMKGKRSK
mmetsp:Transcript_11283/g.25294  ORF Transcript_11283/g.25294 Transcript_11283/m.25294 type:complete len:110 (+) Transcript_11283:96-425(+)